MQSMEAVLPWLADLPPVGIVGIALGAGFCCLMASLLGMDPVTRLVHQKSGPVASSLTFLGLSVAWLGAFVIVCVHNDAAPGHTASLRPMPEAPPSLLFAFGSVFGAQRPTLEVVWRTTCAGLLGMACIGVCDYVYARRTKARWFGLHVIANGWIALLCLPDLWFIMSNPIEALKETRTNHWPTSLVFAVHTYHMVFFRNLQWIDWLHHILMVVVGAPLLITGEMGPLINYNNFFMCGVPGGVDYAMLYAVKHGWMTPLEEKRINKSINVWFRAPALICSSCLAYCQMFLQPAVPAWVKAVRVFLIFLAAWNGLFFMERVVGNYHVSAHKARVHSPKKAARHCPESKDYDSDAHFTPGAGMPGLVGGGLRVAVSTDDLETLLREKKLLRKSD